jgi:2-polyprenyl-6-methoxyphenol hydroxylase-like FAD-dependent oxidoreductase
MTDTQVLIVGAGPTGLVVALWLAHRGVRFRIIDKAAEPGTTSRALVVHARTLEFYRQLGIAEDVISQGREFVAANLWVKGRLAGRVSFGAMGQGLSPFPFALIYPQDEHERLLIKRLEQLGVNVERGTEFLRYDVRDACVEARLRTANGQEQVCSAAYLAGCDGAHSMVRSVLGADFPGGTYEHLFYVADVIASGPVMNGELHIALDEADFIGVFPLHETGQARLIGTVRPNASTKGDDLTWADVSTTALSHLGIQVDHVNWFSTYHVHHRVASQFQQGRVFLLGDAAHIHSPVGGQGMNTGIGDAVNLAWKLADVAHGRSDPSLLDTYQLERVAFAERLVATTDRAFTLVTSTGRIARFVRVEVVPRLLPQLFKSKSVRRLMFRTVSQIAINYRRSPLSQGAAGRIHGGDRLPWVRCEPGPNAATDNFAPLQCLDWQVHVYGNCNPTIANICQRHGLPRFTFPWTTTAKQAGFHQNTLYLIRPDGYTALVDPAADPTALERFLSDHQIANSEQ